MYEASKSLSCARYVSPSKTHQTRLVCFTELRNGLSFSFSKKGYADVRAELRAPIYLHQSTCLSFGTEKKVLWQLWRG